MNAMSISKNGMAMLLARDHGSEEYLDIVTYMVFRTVEANGGTTPNLLKSLLCEFFIPDETVLACTSSLLRDEAYGALNRHNIKDKAMMRITPRRALRTEFKDWLVAQEKRFPQLATFSPPIIK